MVIMFWFSGAQNETNLIITRLNAANEPESSITTQISQRVSFTHVLKFRHICQCNYLKSTKDINVFSYILFFSDV